MCDKEIRLYSSQHKFIMTEELGGLLSCTDEIPHASA